MRSYIHCLTNSDSTWQIFEFLVHLYHRGKSCRIQSKMGKTKLNILLMGKTGEGKSSTGNTILGYKEFKTSSNTSSETKEVTNGRADFGDYSLLLVDGPGLEDTDMNKVKDKKTASEKMTEALAMCYDGVDVFLLVLRFGSRFTEENKTTLDALKNIFGDGFIKHVIVVMTNGDNFQYAMNDEDKPGTSFQEWCVGQPDKVFRQLYQDCDGRFVLFNNREIDAEKQRAQIQEIVQIAHGLQKRWGRYTSGSFKEAARKREKMILELEAPQLKEEFQQKMCYLTVDIDRLSESSSNAAKEKVRASVRDLRTEIDKHDKGYDVLIDLKKLVATVEENLSDKVALIALGEQLKEIRKSKTVWAGVGALSTVGGAASGAAAGVGLAGAVGGATAATVGALAAPVLLPVGLAAAGVGGAVYAGLEYFTKSDDEKANLREQEKIKNRRKN